MVDYPGRFAWYELITTDIAGAKAFYTEVVGWGAQDASTPDLAYTLFTSGDASVSGLMDLPEDATAPGWRGSFAGGIALIAAGLVLFAHTKFGVPLDWLAAWWPLGLVGIGAWLIYEHRRCCPK